jgi:hypothetical protein
MGNRFPLDPALGVKFPLTDALARGRLNDNEVDHYWQHLPGSTPSCTYVDTFLPFMSSPATVLAVALAYQQSHVPSFYWGTTYLLSDAILGRAMLRTFQCHF